MIRNKIAYAGLLVAFVHSTLAAQTAPFEVGTVVPGLRAGVWVHGSPVAEFQKGEVYALIFWNSASSPYAPTMSRLSYTMRSSIHFVSVNVYEGQGLVRTADVAAHREHIRAMLADLPDSVRYSMCMDDARDTLAKHWLPPSNRARMPYAAIIDRQGRLAWVGTPDEMETSLMRVYRNTFDIGLFKSHHDEWAAYEAVQAQVHEDIIQAAKADDATLVDGLKQQLGGSSLQQILQAVNYSAEGNPEFALAYVKSKLYRTGEVEPQQWCYLLANIAELSNRVATKEEAERMCAELAKGQSKWTGVLAAVYHARTLAEVGRKGEAAAAMDKAKADVQSLRPVRWRESYNRFIDRQKSAIQ